MTALYGRRRRRAGGSGPGTKAGIHGRGRVEGPQRAQASRGQCYAVHCPTRAHKPQYEYWYSRPQGRVRPEHLSGLNSRRQGAHRRLLCLVVSRPKPSCDRARRRQKERCQPSHRTHLESAASSPETSSWSGSIRSGKSKWPCRHVTRCRESTGKRGCRILIRPR